MMAAVTGLSYVCLLISMSYVLCDIQDVQIEDTEKVENCQKRSGENDFVTIHFDSQWKNGTPIATTRERGIPIEIQLGTKMISPGLDQGLKGMCVGEKRRVTMPMSLGWAEIVRDKVNDTTEIVYEVEMIDINDRTTPNTFRYLDLNDDKRISEEEAETLVKMFMKALSTDIGVDAKYLISFFMSLHDRDGDNFISEDEFMQSVDHFSNLSKDEL